MSNGPADTGRSYLCIDLKCFYASVECVERGLDPFTTNLVVADPSRGPRTICLAISPAMKELGVRNRCRVFEIPKDLTYEMARPRMRRYMEVSAEIYGLYLRYFSPEDIHVYSVDECFIDVTPYLALYGATPRELAVEMMDLVRRETGICATAGVGTNLFLAKVALDIMAKHVDDHIGCLDGDEYKMRLWHHRPITDIWGIGPGIARRLAAMGIHDMAGVAMADRRALYQEFGVNAELLIDHAWGIEPCTMAEIHAYVPKAHSLSNGQVLFRDYAFDEARTVLREMVDALILDLVDKGLVCGSVSLAVGYAADRGIDVDAPTFETFTNDHGTRRLGAALPHVGVSRKLEVLTSSRALVQERVGELMDQSVDPSRAIRRLGVGLGDLAPEEFASFTLFQDAEAEAAERALAKATLAVKRKFGKNALVRGTSFKEGATGLQRNEQVGGHHE